MIVRNPKWLESGSGSGPSLTFWVDLDKPRQPFGFQAPQAEAEPTAEPIAQLEQKPKKKRKKDKRS